MLEVSFDRDHERTFDEMGDSVARAEVEHQPAKFRGKRRRNKEWA